MLGEPSTGITALTVSGIFSVLRRERERELASVLYRIGVTKVQTVQAGARNKLPPRSSLGARPLKNQKGWSGKRGGVEVYTAEC